MASINFFSLSTLDSDEEVEEKKYEVLQDDDIEGQEDDTIERDDGKSNFRILKDYLIYFMWNKLFVYIIFRY